MELNQEKLNTFAAETKQKHGLSEFDLRHHPQGHIDLELIAVHKGQQGKGTGSAAMHDLTHFADQHGKRVTLSLATKGWRKEWGTTSSNRLKSFYKGHGFVENKGRHKRYDLSMYTHMYREPKPIKEETMPTLTELHKKTLRKYMAKAIDNLGNPKNTKGKNFRRHLGIVRANEKLTGQKPQGVKEETITEGKRSIVSTHEYRNRKAVVYRDPEYNEHQVEFHEGGIHQKNATYHTDDKDDAQGTAKYWVGQATNEETMTEETKRVQGHELHPDDQKHVLRAYVHRYTGQHTPNWVKNDSRYQDHPHFADDQDWLHNTKFAVKKNGRLHAGSHYAESNPTWPKGKPNMAKEDIQMPNQMQSLVVLAQNKQASEFQDHLQEIMVNKVAQALETKKTEVAYTMFSEETLTEKIGHIEHGAFHAWLGKPEDEPITDADIEKGLAAGGHAAKMAEFAKAARGFHHHD